MLVATKQKINYEYDLKINLFIIVRILFVCLTENIFSNASHHYDKVYISCIGVLLFVAKNLQLNDISYPRFHSGPLNIRN